MDRRGLCTLSGLEYIARTRPKVIVLEQVASILHKTHAKVWGFVLKILAALKYKVVFKILNTKNFAVPQSRPRVYLLGVAEEICSGKLEMPRERTKPVDLHHFLNKGCQGTEVLSLPHYEKLVGEKLWSRGFVLDVGSSERFQTVMKNVTPCLTRTRLQQRGYYIPKLRRRLLGEEAARLQGVPRKVVDAMLQAAAANALPERTVEGSLGDGMSINVLAAVLQNGLAAAKLVRQGPEYWRMVSDGQSAASLSDKLFDDQI